jgi:hypothetical protein
MYCPQCGQLQVSDNVRFCSRCGFLLEGVTVVLASSGVIPARYIKSGNQPLSPRSKGVRQGAMLMLSTLLVVPILAIITINLMEPIAHIIIPLAAILCFVGGLLRMLYALMMEDAVAEPEDTKSVGYASANPALDRPAFNALPPASSPNTANWRRPNTAEIYQPPSITENTTRLLDKEDSKGR